MAKNNKFEKRLPTFPVSGRKEGGREGTKVICNNKPKGLEQN